MRELATSLKRSGFAVGQIQGDMDQADRIAEFDRFKKDEINILVASDVAARGLDVKGVSHVINFDVPWQPDDYIHRIGRTGRAGMKGIAITLATREDAEAVAAIEKLIGHKIARVGNDRERSRRPKRASAARSREAGQSREAGRKPEQARRSPRRRPERRQAGAESTQARQPKQRPSRKRRPSARPSSRTSAANGTARCPASCRSAPARHTPDTGKRRSRVPSCRRGLSKRRNRDDQHDYVLPKVWTWEQPSGGQFANINRPIAGPTHDKELPVGKHPFQLYSLATPNGQKVVDHVRGAAREGPPATPNMTPGRSASAKATSSAAASSTSTPIRKIPALVDRSGPEPVRVFESGAILVYLAEKFGEFLPASGPERAETLSWLFWQMGSAPFLGGGFGHFFAYAPEKFEYPINRYAMEAKRQLDVLNRRLAENEYIAGADYSDRRHRDLALVRRRRARPQLCRRRRIPRDARI